MIIAPDTNCGSKSRFFAEEDTFKKKVVIIAEIRPTRHKKLPKT